MTETYLSLGAGVQSSTLALMAERGEVCGGKKPAAAIFADTQAEPKRVYDWLDWLEGQLSFPVYRVTMGDLADDGLQVRISGKSGKTYWKALIPLFTRNKDGEPEAKGVRGILPRKCTAEYKVRVIIRMVRLLVGYSTTNRWVEGDETLVEQWIGISTDEAQRMKPAPEPWIVNRWPLIEHGLSRQDCIQWMADRGYPRPPRSACVFCPYHSNEEWLRLKTEDPEGFARAVEWERQAQAAAARCTTTLGMPFLHKTLVPLGDIDFAAIAHEREPNAFGNECEGMCGV